MKRRQRSQKPRDSASRVDIRWGPRSHRSGGSIGVLYRSEGRLPWNVGHPVVDFLRRAGGLQQRSVGGADIDFGERERIEPHLDYGFPMKENSRAAAERVEEEQERSAGRTR